MIKDRPAHLLNQPNYKKLPETPFAVDFGALPELVRKSFAPLGGIQPVTRAMTKAANGILRDIPSEGEIELFRKAKTRFQPIFVVMNIAHLETEGEPPIAFPYALTLIPTSKRSVIDLKTIDLVAKLDMQKIVNEAEFCYAGFDPFTGDFSLFGPLSVFMYGGGQPYEGFLDELGLVVGQYSLATQYDAVDVLEVSLGLGNEKGEEKYRKHRARLLYTPFENVRTRRIWGAQSPIELFLFQELLRRGMSPLLQILMYEDGAIHPSLYDLWCDIEFRHSAGLITEADMYFPEKKLAVFCDSGKHHGRAKAKAKDAGIDERLKKIGVASVRVSGKLIVSDLKAAADLVGNALAS
jgi:hypothetical protein